MEKINLENWDEGRYKELNTYFRIKIAHLLNTSPQLQEQLQQHKQLQLDELIAHLSDDDRERWAEFLALDKLKMEVDMWNHLHGRGTRYSPGLGFTNPDDDTM